MSILLSGLACCVGDRTQRVAFANAGVGIEAPVAEGMVARRESRQMALEDIKKGKEAEPRQEISTCDKEQLEPETDKVEEEGTLLGKEPQEQGEEKSIKVEETMTEEATTLEKEPQTPAKSTIPQSTKSGRFIALVRCAPTLCSPSSKKSVSPKEGATLTYLDDDALIGA
mmetsp:Transcript_56113/g.97975  ORF Transcript_56113/g.97975 Transcript_56113/m.97975 type:complete len:170 (-) Transcript_56113:182-691(-)